MNDLTTYAACFDKSYPSYADKRYRAIFDLMVRYDKHSAAAFIASPEFRLATELLQPLIEIKNYKSQVPFPMDLSSALSNVIRVRTTMAPELAPLQAFASLFDDLVSIQGFQLPTVSAVFHFSHPRHFPIVDRNVESACAHLAAKYPVDFHGLKLPKIPAPVTTSANKRKKYEEFISFLTKIIELQSNYTPEADFRFVDKALMVIGDPALREKVECYGCGAA